MTEQEAKRVLSDNLMQLQIQLERAFAIAGELDDVYFANPVEKVESIELAHNYPHYQILCGILSDYLWRASQSVEKLCDYSCGEGVSA